MLDRRGVDLPLVSISLYILVFSYELTVSNGFSLTV